MTVEDRLRAAMRAHDADAPTRVPWSAAPAGRPVRHRPPARLLLAAALVAVLAAGGTWLAVAWPRTARTAEPATPLTACPSAWGGTPMDNPPWVPGAPTVPDPSARLAPTTTPVSVLVCGYVPTPSFDTSTGAVPLSGQDMLTGDLAPVADRLALLPRGTAPLACPLYAALTDGHDYLIGLSYGNGTQWVSVPGNHCDGSSNGAFRSSTNLRADAAAWLAAGRFVDPSAVTPTPPSVCTSPPGRLGQDAVMVPDDPVSVTICTATARGPLRGIVVPPGRITDVVSAFNALTAGPSVEHGCPTSNAQGQAYTVEFGYRTGPGVQIEVYPGCGAGSVVADNGSLRSESAADVEALLADLDG